MTATPIRGAIALTALCLFAVLPSSARADDRETSQHYKRGLEFLQQERWDDAIRELNAAAEG